MPSSIVCLRPLILNLKPSALSSMPRQLLAMDQSQFMQNFLSLGLPHVLDGSGLPCSATGYDVKVVEVVSFN